MTDAVVARIFIPLASPGFALIAPGVLAVAKGTFDLIQVSAIVVGLLVVAVAGIFTIRSNVAKIWREQAEGEKARNQDLAAQIAELTIAHAKAATELRASCQEQLAQVQAEANEQRELKHKALTDLAAANMKTDLTGLIAALGDQHREVISRLDIIAGQGSTDAA